MLGWSVYVMTEAEWRKELPMKDSRLLAQWDASVYGLRWLEALVAEGKAAYEGNGGYPELFRCRAEVLLPLLQQGLPADNSPMVFSDEAFTPAGWRGELLTNQIEIAACGKDEILVVSAWDKS